MNEQFKNNFDFLRFVCASLIIVSHSYALLLGYDNVYQFDWHLLIGQFGLASLLVISGYLIPPSWERKPSVKHFMKKRFLRFAPGLCVATFLILLVIGPLATNLPLNRYFAALFSVSTWLMVPIYSASDELGLFTTNPVPYVDAPLWSIPMMFFLYFIVAVLGKLNILKLRHSMTPFIVITFILWLVCYTLQPYDKIRFLIYFFIGAYLWLNRDKLVYKWYAVLGLWVIAFLFFNTQFFFAVAFVAIPYTIIWFANLPLKRLSKFGKYGDFSYGMYIYAYPIQQTIIHFLPSIEVWQLIILSFAITMPVAAASWYLIEQYALSKKEKKDKTEDTEAKAA